MSEIPFRDASKPLWPAAAIILALVFAPAAIASIFMFLRH